MKKFTAAFILLLMIYNLIGYYIVYLYLIKENNDNMSEKYSVEPATHYTKIKLRLAGDLIIDSEYVKIDENEFMYKNNMYDIYKKEYSDGYVIFYCLNDKKEDEIRKSLYIHLEKNKPEGKKQSGFARYKIKKCNTSEFIFSEFPVEKKAIYFLPVINYSNSFRDTDIPPPKIFNI